MGFLLGMYGKLAAGQRVRDIQRKMMRVQSRMRRVTRDVEIAQKNIENWKKMQLNSLRTMSSMQTFGMQTGINTSLATLQSELAKSTGYDPTKSIDISTLSEEERKAYTTAQTAFNTAYQMQSAQINNNFSSINQMMQTTLAQQQSQIEAQADAMKEMMIDPLKDEEADLEDEKALLESQLQLAKADQDGCEKMESEGAKNLVPRYTGNANG